MKRVIRALAGLAVGVAILAAAIRWLGIRPSEIAAQLASVPATLVVGCVASSFVVFALQSLRWHLVMRPVLGMRYGEAYRAQVVGTMFNAMLPARGGDLLRVQYLGSRTGKSRATILGTEVVDRWLDWWGWIPLMTVLALTGELPRWIYTVLAVFLALLVALASALLGVAHFGRRSGKNPRSSRTMARLGEIARSFCDGVKHFVSYRSLFIAFFVAPLPWLWESMVIRQAAQSFDVHLTVAQAFSVLIGLNVGMLVPSPGALGAVEAGGTAALVLCGAGHPAAAAFMVVYHLTQLLPGLCTGVAILVAEHRVLLRRRPKAETSASWVGGGPESAPVSSGPREAAEPLVGGDAATM
jgi:uncharacterized protein (TIRG00374 family)